ALQAGRTPAPLPRAVAGARDGADAKEDGTARVQARRPAPRRGRVGSANDRAAGLGHPLLDGRRQLSDRIGGGSGRRGGRRGRHRRTVHLLMAGVRVELIDRVKGDVRDIVRDGARRLPHLAYADVRLEITEAKSATAENGGAKSSSDDYAFGLG